ncbi:MAG: hypothetical protein WBE98_05055, partial [Gammaproteobacteria bacterium]
MDRGVVRHHEGGKQLGHEVRAAPLVAGERDQGMRVLCQNLLLAPEPQLDVGPHTLGQRVEEAAGKRNPSVMNPVLGSRPNPIDDPSALAYHRRLGTQLEREILEVRVGRVGNDKIGDDRHVALVRRKRNSLGKLRPDFGFHQRCLHLHTLEDDSRVAERIRDFRLLGAACADIGEYFFAISNAIARNSALSDGGSST